MQHKGQNGVGKFPKTQFVQEIFLKRGGWGGFGIPIFQLSFGDHFFVLETSRNVMKHIINEEEDISYHFLMLLFQIDG